MSATETVRFQKLSPRAAPPVYKTDDAAGADLSACLESPITIKPMQRAKVPTGLALEIPRGYEGQVRPRSGLADKYGVTVLNAPGTIDADYRGEVQAILVNLGSEDFVINHGDRIAQLVVAPAMRVQFEESALQKTARASGGFGSTGV